jgi:hypothetical protein
MAKDSASAPSCIKCPILKFQKIRNEPSSRHIRAAQNFNFNMSRIGDKEEDLRKEDDIIEHDGKEDELRLCELCLFSSRLNVGLNDKHVSELDLLVLNMAGLVVGVRVIGEKSKTPFQSISFDTTLACCL